MGERTFKERYLFRSWEFPLRNIKLTEMRFDVTSEKCNSTLPTFNRVRSRWLTISFLATDANLLVDFPDISSENQLYLSFFLSGTPNPGPGVIAVWASGLGLSQFEVERFVLLHQLNVRISL